VNSLKKLMQSMFSIIVYLKICVLEGISCPDDSLICSKNGQCDVNLVNTQLVYSCLCKDGYRGNGTTCESQLNFILYNICNDFVVQLSNVKETMFCERNYL